MGIRQDLKAGRIGRTDALEIIDAWLMSRPEDEMHLAPLIKWVQNYKKSNSQQKVVLQSNKKESKKQRKRRFAKMREEQDA